MRRLLQFLLRRPLTKLAKHTGAPKREAVFKSLGRLYNLAGKKKKRVAVVTAAPDDKFIIFSDQHKGNGDHADEFRKSEASYTGALAHYHKQGFTFISLGDSEELWKYKPAEVIARSAASFTAEAAFQQQGRFYKVFGNHDLLWKTQLNATGLLNPFFSQPLHIWEAVLLKTATGCGPLHIFLTHGHQGDSMSDSNALSSWLVAHVWAPLQRYLQININAPSTDENLRNKHNRMMYEWSSRKKNLLLVTGHTHQPVFASGKYSHHPGNRFDHEDLLPLKPGYFNTGCCCFSDGDITGIEIADRHIRLVKWCDEGGKAFRKVLEEKALEQLADDLL